MNDPVFHAEINVLNKLKFLNKKRKIKWEKIMLMVVRLKCDESGNIHFTMSKPCSHCTHTLHNTRINNICWSNENGLFETCKVCDLSSTHLSRRYRYYT